MRAIRLTSIVALTVGCSVLAQVEEGGRNGVTQSAPLADHHQHVLSPELAALVSATPPVAPAKPRTAADLIAQLDAAGIRRAVVLSAAYIFEQPSRSVHDAAEKVRRENEWTSRQVAQFPDRLIGFCALNPLKDTPSMS